MGRFADEQIVIDPDAQLEQAVDFLDQTHRIDHHAVADDAHLAFAEDARGHDVQDVFLAADEDRVTGVVAALGADHDVRLFGQDIDDFAFAFVTPLGAHKNCVGGHSLFAAHKKTPKCKFGATCTLFTVRG